MKKQNTKTAIVTIVFSLVCLIVGYWLGSQERTEIAGLLTEVMEDKQKQILLDTKTSLKMLKALKEGHNEVVEKLLIIEVRAGLKSAQLTGHDAVDDLSGLSRPDQETVTAASEYQAKYCDDKCLGL